MNTIDAIAIAGIISASATVALAARWVRNALAEAEYWRLAATEARDDADRWYDRHWELRTELFALRRERTESEATRRAQLSEWGRKGALKTNSKRGS